jgi:hypothetical protein
MSDYVRVKAVRYKIQSETIEKIKKNNEDFWKDDIEEYYNKEKDAINTKYDNKKNNLNIGSGLDYETDEYVYFIDYILDYEYGASGDFENVRELTENEYNKYKEIFSKVISDIKPGELRLVHYCYYNGVDEPAVWKLEEI